MSSGFGRRCTSAGPLLAAANAHDVGAVNLAKELDHLHNRKHLAAADLRDAIKTQVLGAMQLQRDLAEVSAAERRGARGMRLRSLLARMVSRSSPYTMLVRSSPLTVVISAGVVRAPVGETPRL